MRILFWSGVLVVALSGAAVAQLPAGAPLDITDPRVVTKPKPNIADPPLYPVASLRAREHGDVKVKLCVTANGDGHDVSLAQSSGFQRLDDASLTWAKQIDYMPAQTKSGPVGVCGYEFTYVWAMPSYGPEEVMFPDIKDLAGVKAPAIATAPDAPVYPAADDPAYASARRAPVKMTTCVGSTGRMTFMTKMSEVGPLATLHAMKWLLGVNFTPAMMDGKPIGVCGVDVEMRWKQPG